MGESFKLHSQALAGYEDSMIGQTNDTSQQMASNHTSVVAAY